jgi:hypothetical protein
MNNKINFNYLESYAQKAADIICSEYYGSRKYMTGQEIIELTPSQQVNLLTIKSLFTAWKEELEKLKSNPYFDYRDNAVDNALQDFMNVLSRAIKVERAHFEPLLRDAIEDAILLAIDPLTFFSHLVDEGKESPQYYKDSKKYIKWHEEFMAAIVEKSSMGATTADLKMILRSKHEFYKKNLEKPEVLLKPLNHVQTLDFEQLLESASSEPAKAPEAATQPQPVQKEPEQIREPEPEKPEPKKEEATVSSQHGSMGDQGKRIDPALAWAKFESEEYSYMKGSVDSLTESVGINQRFMFTRELFQGNPDLLKHALKSIDNCDSFVEAVELINERYVEELNWDKDSDEVTEFLQLVFRKFEHR